MVHQKSNDKGVISNGYVSVAEAAKLLDTTRYTIYRRIKRGEINHVELGGYKLIARSEIARQLKKAS